MSRVKKKRSHTNQYIFEDAGPSKGERLANPESYESRKKKALAERKKKRSVYQKELDKQKEEQQKQSQDNRPRGGRLADKIRKMNADKKDDQ